MNQIQSTSGIYFFYFQDLFFQITQLLYHTLSLNYMDIWRIYLSLAHIDLFEDAYLIELLGR